MRDLAVTYSNSMTAVDAAGGGHKRFLGLENIGAYNLSLHSFFCEANTMLPTLIRLHKAHAHKAPPMPKFFQEGLTLDHVS